MAYRSSLPAPSFVRQRHPVRPIFDPMALPPPDMMNRVSLPESAPPPTAMALPPPPSRLALLRAQRDARLRGPSTPNSRLASGGSMLARGAQIGAGGGLAGILGGGLGGLIAGLVNPGSDEKWSRAEDVGRMDKELQREYALEKADADLAKDRASAEYTALRPELERTKQDVIRARDEGRQAGVGETNRIRALAVNNKALFDREKIDLGRDVADMNRDYRDQIVELRWAGVDQGDERIQQLERRIDENIRHNRATEETGARNATTAETRAGASTTGGLIPPAKLKAASGVVAKFREANELARTGRTTTQRAAAGAKARALFAQIKDTYPDVYTTGLEGDNLTVTPRATLPAPSAAGGGGAKPPMPQANLESAISKKMKSGKFSTRAEAERYIRSQVEVVP